MQYTVHTAKTQLSKLIDAAERGEEVVIARRNVPAVKLVPVEKPQIKFGTLKHLVKEDADNWFEPIDEDAIDHWEKDFED